MAAARPYPGGHHRTAERAATVALIYGIAHGQGLSPNKTLSWVYGLPVDTSGTTEKVSTTLETWSGRPARTAG